MKLSKNTVRTKIMKNIVAKSIKEAEHNANSACAWWVYQPQPPKDLKKFRKF